MKICFIITGLSTGGAEKMLCKLLERLDRQRFPSHVISLTNRGEIGRRIAKMGIPVTNLEIRKNYSVLTAFWRLTIFLRRERPGVVQTWMYHADLLGGLAAHLAGASCVVWAIRNSNLDKDKTRWTTRFVVRLCALFSDWLPQRILSCSERARRIHEEIGYNAGKFHVIPNGFDLSHFKPDQAAGRKIRKELGISEKTPLAGLVARFDPQKNHFGFLKSARILHNRLPEVRFLLAGLGIDAQNSSLMKVIEEEGMANCVYLLGFRRDIPALMAALDVHVLSSFGEAFPNVLGEAMACGVPCVATDVGDNCFIIGDTGHIVPVDDMEGLAQAMERMLTLPTREKAALGEKARNRILAFFEIGQIVRQYETFYEELAEKEPA